MKTMRGFGKKVAAVAVAVSFMVAGQALSANAAPNNVSVAIDNPVPSGTAAYTWQWTGYTSGSTVGCVSVQFNTAADNSGSKPTGMAVASTTLTGTFEGSATWTYISSGSNAATGQVIFTTTPAATGTGAKTLILGGVTNPSNTSTFYESVTTYAGATNAAGLCTGSVVDATTTVAVQAMDGQLASVTVDPSLTFTVAGVAASTGCGTGKTTSATGVTANSTSVNLGHLTGTGSHPIGGQNLTVSTNAKNGYTVFISGTTANLVGAGTGRSFTNIAAASNASPQSWPSAGTEAFGYSTSAVLATGTTTRFSAGAAWAPLTTTGATNEIAYNAGPVSSDVTCVAYQAQVAGLTPADVYSTTVRYDAAPVF